MGSLCAKVRIQHLKYIKDDNIENNILAWKNGELLETNLSQKYLNIIFESNLENYNYYTNKCLNSKNDNHILSYKLSSQNLESINTERDNEINKQLNANEFKKIGIIYWIKKELEEKSQYEKTIKEIKENYNNNDNNNEIYIGALNLNLEGIKKVHNILKENGLKLFAVKSDYNIVKGEPFTEKLDYCIKNKIYFFSCDVFEKGILSGKYNNDNEHYNNQIQKIEKINELLKKNNYKADISQIPIAYNISKGTIPVIDFDELNKYFNNQDAILGSNIKLSEAEATILKRSIDEIEIEIFEE
jgi:hypothetical protein